MFQPAHPFVEGRFGDHLADDQQVIPFLKTHILPWWTPNLSRISLGMVTCPLDVTLAVIMAHLLVRNNYPYF
jgi:hypothetical protein